MSKSDGWRFRTASYFDQQSKQYGVEVRISTATANQIFYLTTAEAATLRRSLDVALQESEGRNARES
jgi:hypothetical protein